MLHKNITKIYDYFEEIRGNPIRACLLKRLKSGYGNRIMSHTHANTMCKQ